ncbi:aminotransferase class V-fold PLP-dependent enzyme [Paenibacillus yanchengensis]|uniref:cysteine desulfurase n=1 Tax=Paenibacillus yanchengensis TaxID=2035833 RepID=A0ABW4YPE3_9BACL
MNDKSYIYLDNAATSWPKPPEVLTAVTDAIRDDGANPGRGSHAMAVRASRILFDGRKQLGKLFNVKDVNDIVFTSNTTMALNMAIKGFIKSGDHVIATSIEHNSVRRPLYELEQTQQVSVTFVNTSYTGELDVTEIQRSIQSNTKLIIVSHSSNLLGSIMPIEQIAELAKRHNIKLLVDGAQSVGILPVDVTALGIDMLAFPGHKGLLGPQGTGGLYISPQIDLAPLMQGGTGSQSETPFQPLVRPDRYEAGTPNTPGIAGLAAGVKIVLANTVEKIAEQQWQLTQRMMEGLIRQNKVSLLGPTFGKPRTGIVSLVMDHIDSSELSFILDQHYKIAVRAGFHCTPLAHQIAGTGQTGAVRASIGLYTTEAEVDAFIDAIHDIAKQY